MDYCFYVSINIVLIFSNKGYPYLKTFLLKYDQLYEAAWIYFILQQILIADNIKTINFPHYVLWFYLFQAYGNYLIRVRLCQNNPVFWLVYKKFLIKTEFALRTNTFHSTEGSIIPIFWSKIYKYRKYLKNAFGIVDLRKNFVNIL